jgi:hypothetical protein
LKIICESTEELEDFTICNENQPDTLFILNLFRQSTSTCFGHVYCPSSGGIHAICTAIGTCYTFNPLTPELNISAQRCLARFFTGDFAS